MAAVFAGQQRLLPQPTDLSCLNWATNRLHSHPSPNFEVRPPPPCCSCLPAGCPAASSPAACLVQP